MFSESLLLPSAALVFGGTALALCTYCYLMILAFRESWGWAVALLVLFPLGGMLYGIEIAGKNRAPSRCFAAAWVCIVLGVLLLDF